MHAINKACRSKDHPPKTSKAKFLSWKISGQSVNVRNIVKMM